MLRMMHFALNVYSLINEIGRGSEEKKKRSKW